MTVSPNLQMAETEAPATTYKNQQNKELVNIRQQQINNGMTYKRCKYEDNVSTHDHYNLDFRKTKKGWLCMKCIRIV
jgi:hypothetical protein